MEKRELEILIHSLMNDLRAPANIVTGYAELLLYGEFGELTPEQKDAMQQIKRSVGKMYNAFDHALVLLWLNNDWDKDPIPLKLGDLLSQTLRLEESYVTGVALSTSWPESLPVVYAHSWLAYAIASLALILANANDKDRSVNIAAMPVGKEEIRIVISGSGSDVNRAIEPYGSPRSFLNIAKQIIAACRSELVVEETADTVQFSFSLAVAEP